MPSPARGTAPAAPDLLFVDSSAWIALFSARDQHHAEADALFRDALGRRARLSTTNLVLAEVHRLLLFRAGGPAASAALDRLESSPALALLFPFADHHVAARGWLAERRLRLYRCGQFRRHGRKALPRRIDVRPGFRRRGLSCVA